MKELAYGDTERVAEVRAWLKHGMKVSEVKAKLESLGYNDYHAAFLLEEATGKSYVPAKPIVIIDTTRIKFMLMAAAVAVLVFIGWWYLGV